MVTFFNASSFSLYFCFVFFSLKLDSMAGDFSPKINGVNASLGSTMSTTTGVEIYYPHGSVLSLNTTQPRVSVRSKLKSYLRKPFTRYQLCIVCVDLQCSKLWGNKEIGDVYKFICITITIHINLPFSKDT